MKAYAFGDKSKPVILLFPGTCCYWKTNFGHAIIGSSDMDQAPKWLAKLETALMIPLMYPLITGQGGGPMKKIFEKKMNDGKDSSDYIQKFMDLMGKNSGIDFSFISKESMKNQFCTDLYTKVGEQIDVPGTVIHVFYAKKMRKISEAV